MCLSLQCIACRSQGNSRTRLGRVIWRESNPEPGLEHTLTRKYAPGGQLKISAACGKGHHPEVRWGRILKSLIEMTQDEAVERELWI